ncbi:PepSY domain-containing protein [Pradoshia sp.]|uniref:PepSY domain-containing protein n=1 Tax=Bacillaceae TaxID=186817 RepID=UPI0026C58833
MKESIKTIQEKMKNKKKAIILTVSSIAALGLILIGGYAGLGYYYAKQNNHYTESQAKEIALSYVDGEVLTVKKHIEMEDNPAKSEYEYEVEVKTADNLLQEVTISARTGTIEIDD